MQQVVGRNGEQLMSDAVLGEAGEWWRTAEAVLAGLQKLEAVPRPAVEDLPDRFAPADIELCELLFQLRERNEYHLNLLNRVIKEGREFEPLVLMRLGDRSFLIDGHHRLEAYRRAGVTQPVPVSWFAGSVKEAANEAGRANTKAKLQTTNAQRMDYAWRLVRLGTGSKREIAEAAAISGGTVANMRKVCSALGEEAGRFVRWHEALRKYQGTLGAGYKWDDEMVDAQAAKYAERMYEAFGNKLANNPSMAALVLKRYCGRQLPELIEELGKLAEPSEDGWPTDC